MNAKKHTTTPDAEEARIQKMIASDPDAPEVTDDQIAKANGRFWRFSRPCRLTPQKPGSKLKRLLKVFGMILGKCAGIDRG